MWAGLVLVAKLAELARLAELEMEERWARAALEDKEANGHHQAIVVPPGPKA